jgi:branched-chain amino acid transport system ATP-binding protein
MIETRKLVVGYRGNAVVSGLDISVNSGEIVALLGRNGAGKTTTINTLAGQIPAVEGEVLLDGKVTREPFHIRARRGVALITEERAIIRRLSVWDNLRLGRGKPELAFDFFPELAPLRRKSAGLLSGGEQQMLVLGRCLAAAPRIFLVDELSFGLAPMVVQRLGSVLKDAAGRGAAVLLVEQHAKVALGLADRAYVIGRGQVETSGTTEELRSRWSDIEASYLSLQA